MSVGGGMSVVGTEETMLDLQPENWFLVPVSRQIWDLVDMGVQGDINTLWRCDFGQVS